MNMKREKPPLEVTLLLAACVTATFALVTSELSYMSNIRRGVEERSCSKRYFNTISEAIETLPRNRISESRDSFDPKLVRRRETPFKEYGSRHQTLSENRIDRSNENCETRTTSSKHVNRSERRREVQSIRTSTSSSIHNYEQLLQGTTEGNVNRVREMSPSTTRRIEQTERTRNTRNRTRPNNRANRKLPSETQTDVSNRHAHIRATERESSERRMASSIENQSDGNRRPRLTRDDVIQMSRRPEVTMNDRRFDRKEVREMRNTRLENVVRNRDVREWLVKQPTEEYSRARYAETKFSRPERTVTTRDTREKLMERPFEEYDRVRYAEIRRVLAQIPDSLRRLDLEEVRRDIRDYSSHRNEPIVRSTRLSLSGHRESVKRGSSSDEEQLNDFTGDDIRESRSSGKDLRKQRFSSERTINHRSDERTRYASEAGRSISGEREGVIKTKRSAQSMERSFKETRRQITTRDEDVTTNVRNNEDIIVRQVRERNNVQRTELNRKATRAQRMERLTRESASRSRENIGRNEIRDSVTREVEFNNDQGRFRENSRHTSFDMNTPAYYPNRQVRDTRSREREFSESKVRNTFNRHAVTGSTVVEAEQNSRRYSREVISNIAKRKVSDARLNRDARQRDSRNIEIRQITDKRQPEMSSRRASHNIEKRRTRVSNDVQDSSSRSNQDRVRKYTENKRTINDEMELHSRINQQVITNKVHGAQSRQTLLSRRTNDIDLGTSRSSREVTPNLAREDRTRDSLRGSSEERRRNTQTTELRRLNEVRRTPERATNERISRQTEPESITHDSKSGLSKERRTIVRDSPIRVTRDEESRLVGGARRASSALEMNPTQERETRRKVRDDLNSRRLNGEHRSRIQSRLENPHRESLPNSFQRVESEITLGTQDSQRPTRERISRLTASERTTPERLTREINSRLSEEKPIVVRDSSRRVIRDEVSGPVGDLRRTSSALEMYPTQERETLRKVQDDSNSRRVNGEQRSRVQSRRENRLRESTQNSFRRVDSEISRESQDSQGSPHNNLKRSNAQRNLGTPRISHLEDTRADYRNREVRDASSNQMVLKRNNRVIIYEDKIRQGSTTRQNSRREYREFSKAKVADRNNIRLNHVDRSNIRSVNLKGSDVRTSVRTIPRVSTAIVRQTREHVGEMKQNSVHTRFEENQNNHVLIRAGRSENDVRDNVSKSNRNFRREMNNLHRDEHLPSPQHYVSLEFRQIYEQRTGRNINNRERSLNRFRQNRDLNDREISRLLLKDANSEESGKNLIAVNVSSEIKRKGVYDSVIKMLHLLKDLVIMSCLILPLMNYFDKKKNLDEKDFTNLDSMKDMETEKGKSTTFFPEKQSNSLIKRFWAKEHLLSC